MAFGSHLEDPDAETGLERGAESLRACVKCT